MILRLPELLFVFLVEHALVCLEDDFVLELVELVLELIRTDLCSISSIGLPSQDCSKKILDPPLRP